MIPWERTVCCAEEQVSGSQCVVPGTGVSPKSESLLQMQILGLSVDQLNEKIWGWGTLICFSTSFAGDSRIRITGLRNRFWNLKRVCSFWRDSWPFGSWPEHPTSHKSLNVHYPWYLWPPRRNSQRVCVFETFRNFLTTPIAPSAPMVISPVLLPEPSPIGSPWRDCLIP